MAPRTASFTTTVGHLHTGRWWVWRGATMEYDGMSRHAQDTLTQPTTHNGAGKKCRKGLLQHLQLGTAAQNCNASDSQRSRPVQLVPLRGSCSAFGSGRTF